MTNTEIPARFVEQCAAELEKGCPTVDAQKLRDTLEFVVESLSPVFMSPGGNGMTTHYGPPLPEGYGIFIAINTEVQLPNNKAPYSALAAAFPVPDLESADVDENAEALEYLDLTVQACFEDWALPEAERKLLTSQKAMETGMQNIASLFLVRLRHKLSELDDQLYGLCDNNILPGVVVLQHDGKVAMLMAPFNVAAPPELLDALQEEDAA